MGTIREVVGGGVEGRCARLAEWRRESCSALATRLAGDRCRMRFNWVIGIGALGM